MKEYIKEKIKSHSRLKSIILNLIVPPIKTRPRLWVRFFQFIYLKRGNGSVIYSNVRKDIVPFHSFILGKHSVIENFSTINNMVGDINIGSNSRIGLCNTIIGPVTIGNNVNLAQNITISGLNHNYQDPNKTIISQGITTSPIIIEDDVWIGANSVILACTRIGKHSLIGAGSVVTKNIPDYSVAVGNPAKIIKQYNFQKRVWEDLNNKTMNL